MELEKLDLPERKLIQFRAAGIESVEELVRYLPQKYLDFRKIKFISEIQNGDTCAVVGMVTSVTRRPKYVSLTVKDKTGYANVYLFGRKFTPAKEGETVIVCGDVKADPQYKTPNIYPMAVSNKIETYRRILPVYKKIPGMSEEYLTEAIERAVTVLPPQDYLGDDALQHFRLITENDAFHKAHRPGNMDDVEAAKRRFVFDDLYEFAQELRRLRAESDAASAFPIRSAKLWEPLTASLGYELTEDQKKVLNGMYARMKSGQRLNALLQGDVGSGKTIVAIFLLALTAENGFQGCLVAPTEILARQHFESVGSLLAPLGLTVCLLTGSLSAREKRKALASIQSGKAQIVVGTHAAIQKSVRFANLGLVIVDEQHRFGVEQRDALLYQKKIPHLITMSATPIPRTLSMALYGGTIEVYNILTKPVGRKPIETHKLTCDRDVNRVILHEIHAGHQCYVICPLIQSSDSEKLSDLRSVTSAFHKIQRDFAVHPEVKPVMIAGSMKQEEIQGNIDAFARGDANVLVSTTIVEVGVNVPNATAIIIKNSERFGLAQLHQLRGRVGRSTFQSYCVLQTTKDDVRADVLCSTADGFEIARRDLELRGPGQYVGTKQSGQNKRIMLSMAYPELFRNVCGWMEQEDRSAPPYKIRNVQE